MIGLTLLLVLAASPAPPPPSCQLADQRVESFIAGQARKIGGKEYCQYRIYETFADVDGDGLADFLVVFSVEGARGGNDFSQFLAVFPSTGGFKPDVLEVGGRGTRMVERIEVQARQMILHTKEYAKGDPMCCPTRPGQAVYAYAHGRITAASARP